jgi:hypothetical protein
MLGKAMPLWAVALSWSRASGGMALALKVVFFFDQALKVVKGKR